MLKTQKFKSGAIFGIIFALIFLIISFLYIIFSFLSILFFFFMVLYSCLQIVVFLLSIILLCNKEKSENFIFWTGALSLFTFFVPGLIILISFFKTKKEMLKEESSTLTN